MTKRINRDDIDKFHDYGLHVPTRTIFLETGCSDEGDEHGVGYDMAKRAIKNLRILDHAGTDPITIIINTEGGDVGQGMAIYDAIRTCRSHVKGLVSGNAQSMGSVILQACDERKATPHATIMYHAGTWDGIADAPFKEGMRAAKYESRFGETVDRLMYERMKTARPDLSWSRFEKETERGMYMTAAEAISWGLLDAIEGVE